MSRDEPQTGLPPGPTWPAWAQVIALLRFRHRFVPAMGRRYGRAFALRVPPGRTPLVVFTGPEAAREIFAGDPEGFRAGRANAILAPIMGEDSVLLQDGAAHQRSRRLLMPAFNGASLRGYRSLVDDIARAEVARWPTGTPMSSLAATNALTLEVILRVVFGVDEEDRLAALRPRVRRTVEVSPRSPTPSCATSW